MRDTFRNKQVAIVLYGIVDERSIKTARALVSAGAQVTIIALTHNRRDFSEETFTLRYEDPAEPRPSTSPNRLLRIAKNLSINKAITSYLRAKKGLFAYRALKEVLLELQPDFVHVVNADVLAGAAEAAQSLGIPFIYEAYEYWPEHAYEEACRLTSAERSFLVCSERKYAACAAAFITVSPYLARLYQEKLSLMQMPQVIFNTPVKYLKTAKPSHRPPQLLFLGNLQEDRNLKTLLDAVTLAKDLHLTFQGSGPLQAYLLNEVKQRGLGDRVRIKEPVPYQELVYSLQEYDLGVYCSLPYNRQVDGALPNKIFEYLSGGLALACTPTAALKEFPNFAHFGTYINPETAASLSEDLVSIIRDRGSLSAMKRASLEEAAKYGGSLQADKLCALYEGLLEGEKSP